jgi:uncharacterized membrane protein
LFFASWGASGVGFVFVHFIFLLVCECVVLVVFLLGGVFFPFGMHQASSSVRHRIRNFLNFYALAPVDPLIDGTLTHVAEIGT